MIRFSDLDAKNNLNWVLNEIKIKIAEIVTPTPNSAKEGENLKL
jgi:hypothetical protein